MSKPVAWIGIRRHGEKRVSIEKLANDDIPLYTHLVKELTDEEIMDVWCSTNDYDSQSEEALNFAKAILRKAQRK